MSAGTGENEMGLRKILDFTRLGSITILLLHFYYCCYGLFHLWGLTAEIGDRFLLNIAKTGLLKSQLIPKMLALVLLAISLLGSKGKKTEKGSRNRIICYLVTGFAFY